MFAINNSWKLNGNYIDDSDIFIYLGNGYSQNLFFVLLFYRE